MQETDKLDRWYDFQRFKKTLAFEKNKKMMYFMDRFVISIPVKKVRFFS